MLTMNSRKLTLPLLVLLTCVATAVTVLPAAAAPQPSGHRSGAKVEKLRITSIKVGTKAGPLVVRVAANVHSRVSMTANGKRVTTPFEFTGPKAQTVELRAADNLRAGSNVLRIRAVHAGVVSTATRRVNVPGWTLLADAGEDLGTPNHVDSRIGTAPSRGPARADVDYSWNIVRGPKDAGAKLADADDSRPTLEASQPGTYLLQEEANPEGDATPTSLDQVTVAVAPNDPPIGVPINTMGGERKIVIGGQSYGGVGLGSDELDYVVLERTTRAVLASGVVYDENDGGMKKLTDLADQYGSTSGTAYMRYMMIVSGAKAPAGDAQVGPFFALLKKLGVALPSAEEVQALKSGAPFSVIGVPGAPAGAATLRVSPSGYTPPISAAISGYLQPNQAVSADGTPLYEYVAGEQPTFKTKAPGSTATTNEMVIGGQAYTGSLPSGTTAGLHVVALQGLTLQPISNQVLATNGSGSARVMQGAAAGALAKTVAMPGGPLVFVQTIGKPSAAGPEWQGIVNSLVRLGANPELVNALNGTTEYALASRVGSKAPPAESSTAYDKGPYPAPNLPPASLVGTLARSRTSNFVPNLSGTPTAQAPDGGINLGLTEVAYQPSQDWPVLPGGLATETAKAEHFICEGMEFCQGAGSCPTVRECFWQKYGTDWDRKLIALQALKYPGVSSGFSERAFESVRTVLFTETKQVANVVSYLKRLQEPFEKSDLSSYIDLQNISSKIYDSVQPPAEDNSSSWTLGLVSKMIALGGVIPPPGRYAAAGLAAAFGLASYVSEKSGQPILGSEITARAKDLGSELVERIALARKTTLELGMMIVSDPGKLATANQHIISDWALPNDIQPAIDAYRTSAKQWFYEALIPTAFPYLIRAKNANNARYLNCYSSTFAWPNQPDTFQMNATTGYEESGTPINSVFFFTKGIGGASSPNSSIGDEMFRPLGGQNPGLGMEKLQFFSRVFGGAAFHAINDKAGCAMSWLPPHT